MFACVEPPISDFEHAIGSTTMMAVGTAGGAVSKYPAEKSKIPARKSRGKELRLTSGAAKMRSKSRKRGTDKSDMGRPRSVSVPEKISKMKDRIGASEMHLKKKKDDRPSDESHSDEHLSQLEDEYYHTKDLPSGASVYKGWKESAGVGAS